VFNDQAGLQQSCPDVNPPGQKPPPTNLPVIVIAALWTHI